VRGFSTEELGVDSAVWRRELWVDEDAALRNCLQRRRTLVWKAKSNKQLFTHTHTWESLIVQFNPKAEISRQI